MSMYTYRIMAHADWYKIVPAEELEDWRNLTISNTAYMDGFHVLGMLFIFRFPQINWKWKVVKVVVE